MRLPRGRRQRRMALHDEVAGEGRPASRPAAARFSRSDSRWASAAVGHADAEGAFVADRIDAERETLFPRLAPRVRGQRLAPDPLRRRRRRKPAGRPPSERRCATSMRAAGRRADRVRIESNPEIAACRPAPCASRPRASCRSSARRSVMRGDSFRNDTGARADATV